MQTKSSPSNTATLGSGVLQVMRTIGVTVITITAVMVLVGTMLGLSGCSGSKRKNASSPSKESSSVKHDPVATTPAVTTTSKPAVTARKKPVTRPRTVAYSSGTYGLSFRFPSQYTLTTPKDNELSVLPESVPTNFVQPGGVTLATLELANSGSTSFFSVSAHKGLNYQQCQQFSVPDASDMAANSPVDSHDESIPSRTSIHAVEFSKVENSTEQEDVRYYHHFEPTNDGTSGTCYEFALGVEDLHVSSKALDQPELFDKLERIMATVKINQQSSIATTVPTRESNGTSPQQ